MAKPSKRTAEFIVRLELPEGCSKARALEYVRDAVAGDSGRYHPDDPIFDLDHRSVKARHLPRPKATPC